MKIFIAFSCKLTHENLEIRGVIDHEIRIHGTMKSGCHEIAMKF